MAMNQVIIVVSAIFAVLLSGWAIIDAIKSPTLRYRWLWVFGSLFSFFGLRTNIAASGDLFLWGGINIPAIGIVGFANGDIILSAGVPVVALIVLAKTRYYARKSSDEMHFR